MIYGEPVRGWWRRVNGRSFSSSDRVRTPAERRLGPHCHLPVSAIDELDYNIAIFSHRLKEVTNMEVVFIQDVANQARAGELKRVADGFARNYLIPQGLAEIATPEVLKRLHKIKAAGDDARVRESQTMQELAEALDETRITLSARVTPTGRYYGTITSTRIAAELGTAVGRTIDRRLVESGEPIREPGDYEISLRFSNEIQATVYITAEVEE